MNSVAYREVDEVEVVRGADATGPWATITLRNGPRVLLERTVTEFCAYELGAGMEIRLHEPDASTWVYSRVDVLGGRNGDSRRPALLRRRSDGAAYEYLLMSDFLDSMLVRGLDSH